MIEIIEAAVRIHQSNEKVVSAAKLVARILEKIIFGLSAIEAIRWAKSSPTMLAEDKQILEDIEEMSDLPFSVAVDKHGLNGQVPGCLKASLYGVKVFRGYEVSIRSNLIAA